MKIALNANRTHSNIFDVHLIRSPISLIINYTGKFLSIIKSTIVQHFLNSIISYLTPKKTKSIYYWREYFFNIIFFYFMLFKSIIFIASSIRLIIEKNYNLFIISTFLFLLTLLIIFFKKLPYTLRSYIGCSIFYFVGFFVFYNIGPISSGLCLRTVFDRRANG